MNHTDIVALAEQAGIATEWADAHGLPQHSSPMVLAAMLEALGLPCGGETQWRDSKARLATQQLRSTFPPMLTAQVGHSIRLPCNLSLHGQAYSVVFEHGESYHGRFPSDKALPLYLLPIDRSGYHTLFVGGQSVTLAVAPTRCFGVADAIAGNVDPERPATGPHFLWGLSVQLYSLRRQGDGGLGDYTTLKKLAVETAQQGAAALAISPVHAMFSADPTRYSPYGPSSRLFLNAMHIDPAMAFEAGSGHGVSSDSQPLVLDPATAALHQRLEHMPLIDWPAAAGSRLALLGVAYTQFLERGPDSAFEQFCQEGGRALQDHACYEALQAWLPSQVSEAAGKSCGDWRSWPAAYRDPQGPAVRDFAQRYPEQIGFYLFLQWQAAQGLIGAQQAARAAGMSIGLIADLAIGAEHGGSQAWSEQGEMLKGLSIGAPPDLLNVSGQNWGLVAYSPSALQAHGFGPFIAMLRACFAHAGGARIDHVLGLARLWLVPEGASAGDGAYLRYPLEDMLRLIALESWRYRAIVIGENLGTVPPGFDARLAEINLLGIDLLWFQRDRLRFMRPMAWSENAIATTTTHDLPTVAGWWSGTDISWRARLGLLEAGRSAVDEFALRDQERQELWQAATENGCAAGPMPQPDIGSAPLEAAVALVGSAPAPLVLIPVEDILGLAQQPNLPGTTESLGAIHDADDAGNPSGVGSHPNWRRRLPVDVTHLFQGPSAQAALISLKRARANAEKDERSATAVLLTGRADKDLP